MAEIIDPLRFVRVYRQSIRDVMQFITRERQTVIARHDLSLHPDNHDLGLYLEASERRYQECVGLCNRHISLSVDDINVLEVGGFLGAYPLTLARMGLPVTLVEQYDYYNGGLDELAAFLQSEGVKIWNTDFTVPLDHIPERFTLVSNMAMLEHLAHSPKTLMDNLRLCIDERGLLIVDLPNVAYWANRLKALRGLSIHQSLDQVYASASPYLGHHREYTVKEIGDLLAWTGFVSRDVKLFNYSVSLRDGTLLDRLYALLVYVLPTLLFDECKEVIMVAATPTQEVVAPVPLALVG